jgi:hypothetical protein
VRNVENNIFKIPKEKKSFQSCTFSVLAFLLEAKESLFRLSTPPFVNGRTGSLARQSWLHAASPEQDANLFRSGKRKTKLFI